MRILHLVTRRQYRGAEVFTAKLSEGLIEEGHEVCIAGLYKAPVHALEVSGARLVDFNGNASRFIDWKLLLQIRRFVASYQPDVIQANGSDTLKYAVLATLWGANIPVVYRNISMISQWIGGNLLKKKFYEYLFRRAQHVSSVGQASIDDLIATLSYPRENTSVIRRGITIQSVDKLLARQRVRAEFSIGEEAFMLLHVGNLSPEKNHLFLLEVISELKKRHLPVFLLMLGSGSEEEKIRLAIAQKGLESCTCMAGFRSDVQSIMAASDLLLLCSLVEGVPGVVLEAGAQHLPSVAVDVGSVSEAIDGGGILLERHDVVQFTEAIIRLYNDRRLLSKMGELAYAKVYKEYNPSDTTRKFIDIYQKLHAQTP